MDTADGEWLSSSNKYAPPAYLIWGGLPSKQQIYLRVAVFIIVQYLIIIACDPSSI